MVETRGGRRFAVFFILAAFLLLLLGRWIRPVDNVTSSVAAPFAAVINGAATGMGDTVSGIFDAGRLRAENAALTRQNAKLVRELVAAQAQSHDMSIMRTMLKFQNDNTHMDLLLARVVWTDPTGLGQYVMIDKGTRDGLQQNMAVLDQNGFFVGQIADAHSNNSTVLLMESPSSSIGAVDLKTRAGGLVEGRFAGTPQLRDVLIGDRVRPNDLIVTSGQLNLFPRNLLLGQVTSVVRRKYEVFQTANIRPAADLEHLEIVQVVRNWNRAVPTRYIPAS